MLEYQLKTDLTLKQFQKASNLTISNFTYESRDQIVLSLCLITSWLSIWSIS